MKIASEITPALEALGVFRVGDADRGKLYARPILGFAPAGPGRWDALVRTLSPETGAPIVTTCREHERATGHLHTHIVSIEEMTPAGIAELLAADPQADDLVHDIADDGGVVLNLLDGGRGANE